MAPGGTPSPRWAILCPLLASGLVALSVVGPLTTKGYLLLLDWVPGRHPAVPRSVFGLDGGLLTGAPFHVLIAAVAAAAPSPAVVGWLPLAVFFPLGAVGMARLLPGGALERTAGTVLYCVNPFVLDRAFAGHLGLLLGYALLPFAARSILVGVKAHGGRQWLPALWIAAMTALSPHFAWITGVLLVSVVIARSDRARALRWAAGILAAVALANTYVVSMIVGAVSSFDGDSARNLAAYRTRGGSGGGLFVNVAGLDGFWRADPRLVDHRPSGWPATLAAILVVVLVGAWISWRTPRTRPLAAVVAVAGAAGYFLAMGDQGPTGWLFAWMFDHLPGFAVMREPQKFACLLALAYATFFGAGTGALVRGLRRSWQRGGAAFVLLAGPLLWAPSLLGGLGGAVRPSHYPPSWYEADAVMGTGQGKVLVLPWHEYTSFPFTGGRVVHAPAASFFRREAIVGDNVELPGVPTTSTSLRSKYLEFLFANAATMDSFGELVAPLGVEYVLVSRLREAAHYEWVDDQRDLSPVLVRDDVVVYQNTRRVAPGMPIREVIEVEDWGELVGLAGVEDLDGRAVRVRREEPGPVRSPGRTTVKFVTTQATEPIVRKRSPVDYEVSGGPGSYVVVAEPFEPGWRLGGTRPQRIAGGVMGFPAGPGPEQLRYRRWSQVRSGYLISVGSLIGLAAMATLSRRGGQTAAPENWESPS